MTDEDSSFKYTMAISEIAYHFSRRRLGGTLSLSQSDFTAKTALLDEMFFMPNALTYPKNAFHFEKCKRCLNVRETEEIA